MPDRGLGAVLGRTARVLFFRASREELMQLDRRDLAFGMLCVWLVGMGRYWDDPGARTLQHLGLGSLAYVVVLSAVLWIVIRPLGPKDWSFERLLTYVCLVSPPAALYAIPVERFLTMDTARLINGWFLTIVATWRVALLVRYLFRLGELRPAAVTVGTLLPLTAIITALVALNLERAVFEIMGGMREGTSNDGAYGVLILIKTLSLLALIPTLLTYCVLVVSRLRRSPARP